MKSVAMRIQLIQYTWLLLWISLNYWLFYTTFFYWKLGIYTFAQGFLNKTAFLFKCFFGMLPQPSKEHILLGWVGGAEKGMMRLTRCLQWVELPGFYPVEPLKALMSGLWLKNDISTDRGVWDCKTKAYFVNTAPEISSAKRVTDACSSLKKCCYTLCLGCRQILAEIDTLWTCNSCV